MSRFIIKNEMKIIFVFIIFLASVFYNGLTLREYKINDANLNGKKKIRIVLLADLHSHIYGKNQKNLLNEINKQNPDIIAMAGDIADDEDPIDGVKMLLKGIKEIAPSYYVTGNHEFWSGNVKEIKKLFTENGVIILEGNYYSTEINGSKVNIGGIDDPYVLKYDKKLANKNISYGSLLEPFKDLPKSEYNILLAHRPEEIDEYKKYAFDLVLSGHSHGGQLRIPFILNGLYAPNQGFFPKYSGGMYVHENLIHIISRGLSFNPRLPRIFNPPEIVVIDIIPKGITKS